MEIKKEVLQKKCKYCGKTINRGLNICPFCDKHLTWPTKKKPYHMLGMEVFKKSLNEEEAKFFRGLFNRLVRRYGLYEIEDRIALERLIKNYIKLLRAEAEIKETGILITYVDQKTGEEKQRVHPAQFYVNQWEAKLLDWLKAMSLTRKQKGIKDTVKQDFARELSSDGREVNMELQKDEEGKRYFTGE